MWSRDQQNTAKEKRTTELNPKEETTPPRKTAQAKLNMKRRIARRGHVTKLNNREIPKPLDSATLERGLS